MELTRREILPGVWLSHLRSDKFKTACLSLNLLTQLQRDTASLNALIPYVLRRGTRRYGDMEALSARASAFTPASPRGIFCPTGRTCCATRRS